MPVAVVWFRQNLISDQPAMSQTTLEEGGGQPEWSLIIAVVVAYLDAFGSEYLAMPATTKGIII